MPMPLPTHKPDTTLGHALSCASCWSTAIRGRRDRSGMLLSKPHDFNPDLDHVLRCASCHYVLRTLQQAVKAKVDFEEALLHVQLVMDQPVGPLVERLRELASA